MPSLLDRLRGLASRAGHDDRRNIAALADRLGISIEEAARIFARSREVGHGAAMLEYEERCREQARG